MFNSLSPQLKNVEKHLSTPSLAERITDILSSQPTRLLEPKERFLLEYVQLIVYFRLAIRGKRETAFALSKALDIKEGVGRKTFSFSKEELLRLNVFVRDTYRTEERLNWIGAAVCARLARTN